MPETFYTSSQYYNLFFQMYVNGGLPFPLMLGREVRLPAEVIVGSSTCHPGEEVALYGHYVNQLRDRLQSAHDVARKHLRESALRQKDAYDAKLSVNSYQPGDLVWYHTDIGQLHVTPKLRNAYEGPFVVVQKLNDLDYKIQRELNGRKRVVHHNRLKPYGGAIRFKWASTAVKRASRGDYLLEEPEILRRMKTAA